MNKHNYIAHTIGPIQWFLAWYKYNRLIRYRILKLVEDGPNYTERGVIVNTPFFHLTLEWIVDKPYKKGIH